MCVVKVGETLLDKVRVLGSQQVYKAKRTLENTSVLRFWWGSFPVTKYCTSRNGESGSRDMHRCWPGGFLSGHAIFIALHNSSPAFFSCHQTCRFILTVHLLLTSVPPPHHPYVPLPVARPRFILKPFAALSRSLSLGHAIVLATFFFF